MKNGNPFYTWAIKHGISLDKIHELMHSIGVVQGVEFEPDDYGKDGESLVQAQVRIRASELGIYAYRNNSGAFKDPKTGRAVRYGLANDSARINKVLKSPDLIGWYPVLITEDMVGQYFARLWLRECKKPGWVYTGTDEEKAQLAFLMLALSCGADAAFTNGSEETI